MNYEEKWEQVLIKLMELIRKKYGDTDTLMVILKFMVELDKNK